MKEYLFLFIILYMVNWLEGLLLLGTILYGAFVKLSDNKKVLIWLVVFLILRVPLSYITCSIGYGCKSTEDAIFSPGIEKFILYGGLDILVLFAVMGIRKLITKS